MDKKEFKKKYNGKKKKIDKKKRIIEGFEKIGLEDFIAWFKPEEFNKGCHYCGLKNEQSRILYELRPNATRGGKRGKRLELDRKDPTQPYDNLSNIVWCCYWCNNAKSNFYSAEEFKLIALAIGSTNKEILNNANQSISNNSEHLVQ